MAVRWVTVHFFLLAKSSRALSSFRLAGFDNGWRHGGRCGRGKIRLSRVRRQAVRSRYWADIDEIRRGLLLTLDRLGSGKTADGHLVKLMDCGRGSSSSQSLTERQQGGVHQGSSRQS